MTLKFETNSGSLLNTNDWSHGDENQNEDENIKMMKTIHMKMKPEKIKEWMQKNYMKLQEYKIK